MAELPQRFYVLLVEDNPADERLIREAFQVADPHVSILSASSGAEALALLRRERPNLILLDLNLPAVDGREMLEAVKGDKRLRHIPIAVLTSSIMRDDVMTAYRGGANCYIQKPTGLDVLFRKIRDLHRFWTQTAVLPACE